MSDVASLAESLHPHEAKVLTAFDAFKNDDFCTEEELAKRSGLEIAQVGAALGRLQLPTKGLVALYVRAPDPVVSLTETGQRYFQRYTPMVRILSALRISVDTGAQLTIKDLQEREGLDPSELSGAVGELKQEGVIKIAVGGVVELTGTSSKTAESLQELIQRVTRAPNRWAILLLPSKPSLKSLRKNAVNRTNRFVWTNERTAGSV